MWTLAFSVAPPYPPILRRADQFSGRLRAVFMNERARRAVAPLASCAAVLTLVAAASQLGAQLSRDNGSAFVSADGLPSASSTAVQARADEVFETLDGTVRQRNASGALQAWSLNGAMDQCMEREGFAAWDWSTTRNIAPRTNALATSVFFASPLSHSYSNALMDMAESARAEQKKRMATLSPEEDAAVGRCLEATPRAPDSAATTVSTPDGVPDLRSAWWAMLRSWDRQFGDVDDYHACFATASSASGLDAGADSWQQELAGLAPSPLDMPSSETSAQATAPAWSVFRRTEALLETVDWQCRRAAYADHLDEVDAAVSAFAQTHAETIDRAQVGWRDIEDRAAALGFHGQSGSLNG